MNPIKQAREEKGYTITELAVKTGVTEQTMYRYERKKPDELGSVKASVMYRLSEVLDKPINFFIGKC